MQFADIRRKTILEKLAEQDFVSLHEIVKKFSVSEMTVRRDLTELERRGLLIRKYGGAIRTDLVETMFSFNQRVTRNSEKKEAICRIAADFIEPGDVVFIDCGSTLYRMAHFIKDRNIRVITNSLPVVSELMSNASVKVSLIGGEIVEDRQASYGRIAEQTIAAYSADKAFLGADGISLATGLTSFDEQEAMVTRKMAERSKEIFFLCDSSKIEKDSFFRFASVDLVQNLVTDSFADEDVKNAYIRKGIRVITTQNAAARR